jgi:hypothetical protein
MRSLFDVDPHNERHELSTLIESFGTFHIECLQFSSLLLILHSHSRDRKNLTVQDVLKIFDNELANNVFYASFQTGRGL